MDLSGFVSALFEGSVVTVGLYSAENFTEPEQTTTLALLQDADASLRLNAPLVPPPLDPAAALWAAKVLGFACDMIVDRIDTETQLPADLIRSEPTGTTAAEHWSVDVVFRFLWDVIKRASSLNEQDSLNVTLRTLAARWPLSAVGSRVEFDRQRFEIVWADPCLRKMLVDRIVLRADHKFSDDPRVKQALERV